MFFDLAFAAAIADAGSALSADYTFAGLLRFGGLFLLIWWAWVGHTYFSTWFDNDDLIQRLLTLGQVFLVAVMSINTKTDMASREAAGFAAAYAGMRLLLAVQFSRVVFLRETRPFVRTQVAGIAVAALIWLTSSLVEPPLRVYLMGFALLVDGVTPFVARRSGGIIPADPAHLPERFGLLTLILLGESVVAIAAGMRHQEHWTVAAAASALSGMVLAFTVWWAYFDTLRLARPRVVETPADHQRLRIWTSTHLPLTFGIAVAAVGVEHVIRRDGITPLGNSAALLGGGVGLVVLSLGVLAVVRAEGLARPWAAFGVVGALGLLVVPVATVGARLAPVWLVVWCVGVLLGGVALAYRTRTGLPPNVTA